MMARPAQFRAMTHLRRGSIGAHRSGSGRHIGGIDVGLRMTAPEQRISARLPPCLRLVARRHRIVDAQGRAAETACSFTCMKLLSCGPA